MVTKHSLPNTIYSVYHHIIPFNKPLAQSVIIPFNTAVMMTVQFACFAQIHDRTLHWTKLELSFSYLYWSLTKALLPKRQKSLAQCHSVPKQLAQEPLGYSSGTSVLLSWVQGSSKPTYPIFSCSQFLTECSPHLTLSACRAIAQQGKKTTGSALQVPGWDPNCDTPEHASSVLKAWLVAKFSPCPTTGDHHCR